MSLWMMKTLEEQIDDILVANQFLNGKGHESPKPFLNNRHKDISVEFDVNVAFAAKLAGYPEIITNVTQWRNFVKKHECNLIPDDGEKASIYGIPVYVDPSIDGAVMVTKDLFGNIVNVKRVI